MTYYHEMFTLGCYRKPRTQKEIDEYRGIRRNDNSTAMCAQGIDSDE